MNLKGSRVLSISHGCMSCLEPQGAGRARKTGSKVLVGEQSGVVVVKGMCGELGMKRWGLRG